MAGTIAVSLSSRWSVATGLFHWVLTSIAEQLGESELADGLGKIVDNNLGWLGLDDFTEEDRRRLLMLIGHLPTLADQQFSAEMPGRANVLAHLRELVELTGADGQ